MGNETKTDPPAALLDLARSPDGLTSEAVLNALGERGQLDAIKSEFENAIRTQNGLLDEAAVWFSTRKKTLQRTPAAHTARRILRSGHWRRYADNFLDGWLCRVHVNPLMSILRRAHDDESEAANEPGESLLGVTIRGDALPTALTRELADSDPGLCLVLALYLRVRLPSLAAELDPWLARFGEDWRVLLAEAKVIAEAEPMKTNEDEWHVGGLDDEAYWSSDGEQYEGHLDVEVFSQFLRDPAGLPDPLQRLFNGVERRTRSPSEVRDDLRVYRDRAAEFAATLETAAKSLREGAFPGPVGLARAWRNTRRQFLQLYADVEIGRAESGLEERAPFSDLAALEAGIEAWESVQETHEAAAAARETLGLALRIRHRRDADFAPIASLRQTVNQLLDALEMAGSDEESDVAAEIAALKDGTHPVATLVRVVHDFTALGESDLEAAGAALGSLNHLLTVAALVGRLEIGPAVPASAEPEPEPEPQAGATAPGSTARAEPPTMTLSVPEPAVDDVTSVTIDVPAVNVEPETVLVEVEAPVQVAPALDEDQHVRDDHAPSEPAAHETTTAAEGATANDRILAAEIADEMVESVVPQASAPPDLSALSRRELGRAYLNATTPESKFRLATELAFRLLLDGRPSVAAHLVAGAQAVLGADKTTVPYWLFRALVLAPHLMTPAGELAVLLRETLAQFDESLIEEAGESWAQGITLFLIGGALRPALIVPGLSVASALRHPKLPSGLDSLYAYCTFVADNAAAGGLMLDPALLRGVTTQAEWETQLRTFRHELEEWWSDVNRRTLAFQAATAVWKKMLDTDGPVEAMLRPVRANDTKSLGVVRDRVELLSQANEVRRTVDHIDRKVLGRRRGAAIMARAYQRLAGLIDEAVEQAAEWLRLHEVAPGRTDNYRLLRAQEMCKSLLGRHERILADLRAAEADLNGATVVRAGLACVRAAIADIDRVFRDPRAVERREPPVLRVENVGLLRVPGIRLAPNWAVEQQEYARAEAIARSCAEHDSLDWREALHMRSEQDDHVGTSLLIAEASAHGWADEVEIARLQADREALVGACRTDLNERLVGLSHRIEQAVMHGLLTETDRADLVARVGALQSAVDDTAAFDAIREDVGQVEARLDRVRAERVADLRSRMEQEAVTADHPDRSRIEAVLAQGDVLTAEEYIDFIRRGVPIPTRAEQRDPFTEFFPAMVRAAEAGLPTPNRIVSSIAERRKVGPFDFADLTEAQAAQTADVLKAFFAARQRRGTASNEAVRHLFSLLGFNVLSVGATGPIQRNANRIAFDLTTEPVRDRTRCPVPHYGTFAAGDHTSDSARYRVLWVFDDLSAEDLVGAVGDTLHEQPTFVLFSGTLPDERRRRVARLCREERRTFVVIDDALLLYLAASSQARMPLLYECALPFTYTDPYATTGVPTEMFYGRELERRSIIEPRGSCFIYGGRQLGKTALLRHVQRGFHDLGRGHIAIYLDIKMLGHERGVDELWAELIGALRPAGVTSLPRTASDKRLLRDVEAWLADDSHRRILVLLDEADRWLEADAATHFVRVDKIKASMDRTDRRFKVVFAGLHNVQRTTRAANNPLAHLGEPRCIGPLIEGSEWQFARELIERPLMALGYRFATPDLVVRILSQTNYYPVLLQLYGSHIIRRTTGSNAQQIDPRSSPPYRITPQLIDQVYQQAGLQLEIRGKFALTLDLDQRYHFIALLIAHFSDEEPARAVEGFTTREIRERAHEIWKDGFENSRSEDAFRVLLDEMIGLGILRETSTDGSRRYALRNGNVPLLMGTPEEILEGLITLSEQEPHRPYAPRSRTETTARPGPPAGARSQCGRSRSCFSA